MGFNSSFKGLKYGSLHTVPLTSTLYSQLGFSYNWRRARWHWFPYAICRYEAVKSSPCFIRHCIFLHL